MPTIKRNDIIISSRWPEPIEVKHIEYLDSYIHIIGSTLRSREHIDQIIPLDELDSIEIKHINTDFKEEAWKIFLALEAKRYRFASLYDPLLAMNVSKIDPLPHQIEAVYGYILKLPTIRFLIADDPGAGKTIMAGLLIKELKLRGIVKRILIIVPGHLKDQWRRELREKFDEGFVVIDRSYINSHYGENVWDRENQIITSMDFAKKGDILPSLSSSSFDLVIIDEAHKLAAYIYGDKLKTTDRYILGEKISKITTHLLFLTATPHKGDPENFRLLLDLLQPGFFVDSKMVDDSIKNKDNPLFIRRIKEDLKDFYGKPLFMPRYVNTISFSISDNEKLLYNDLTRYIREQYNKALLIDNNRRRNITFTLIILQRRLASSVYALFKSLERRKKKLESIIDDIERYNQEQNKIEEFDLEEIEELSEEERWEKEELWETLSVAKNKQELFNEIETIKRLIENAKTIVYNEEEKKISELKKALSELNTKYPNEKILIFTESRDTLNYLEKKIKQWGYSVNVIHGGMSLEQRVEAEKIFKNETQIMVATEAAGEGINLQFCHLMINYDIPWNPNRLEQRMGRIHRYGQTKDVHVFNMVAEDTIEGKILSKLFKKLKEIESALGSNKVYDVIGDIFHGKDLAQLMVDAITNTKNIDDILKDLDIKVDEEYIRKVKDSLGESLATRYIDYTMIKEMATKAKENRLIPEYTQEFFKRVFTKVGGKIREIKNYSNVFAIDHIPYELKGICDDEFKRRFGSLLNRYSRITFDKDIAKKDPNIEFVSFGHPLFEAVMLWVEKNLYDKLSKGACFLDPEGRSDGYIIFYEGYISDGFNKVAGRRLFSYYISRDLTIVNSIHPSIIWDLVEGNADENDVIDIEELKKKAYVSIIEELKVYRDEIKNERDRQANIKMKYGVESLKQLILKLDRELIELNMKKERGENVDIVIWNKTNQKDKYCKALDDLKESIEKESNLSINNPVFITAVRVKPMLNIDDSMYTDEEIERIGMSIAMEYEEKNGRSVEDVSRENLGFDLRSIDSNGNIRYIEVKARADRGSISLTQNEWFKAQRLGDDYYLYIVWNAKSNPELKIIQNPAKNLNAKERVEMVRYIIDANEIINKAKYK